MKYKRLIKKLDRNIKKNKKVKEMELFDKVLGRLLIIRLMLVK